MTATTHYPLLISGVVLLGSIGYSLYLYTQYSTFQQQVQDLQSKLPDQPLDKMTSGKTPEENAILRDYKDVQTKIDSVKSSGTTIAIVAVASCIGCLYFYSQQNKVKESTPSSAEAATPSTPATKAAPTVEPTPVSPPSSKKPLSTLKKPTLLSDDPFEHADNIEEEERVLYKVF